MPTSFFLAAVMPATSSSRIVWTQAASSTLVVAMSSLEFLVSRNIFRRRLVIRADLTLQLATFFSIHSFSTVVGRAWMPEARTTCGTSITT